MQKEISPAVIKRMPRYYRYLSELLESGVERISSAELSSRMHVTASQIRQDLNNFGEFGQQGYGYNVAYLHNEIKRILGLDMRHRIIVIGAGHLGQALTNYERFVGRGFVITALFDNDPQKIGHSIREIPIFHMDELEVFVKENNIDIAALTLPKQYAKDVADRLVALGIKGIWNFAHLDLEVPDDVSVENVHLSDSLMRLSYLIKSTESKK